MIDDIRNPLEEQLQQDIIELKETQQTLDYAFKGLVEKVNEMIECINRLEEKIK